MTLSKPIHPEVQCTIWIREPDGRFNGTMSNDGGLLEAGATLIHHYPSLDDARRLIRLGALRYIPDDPDAAETMNRKNSGPMFKNYGQGMAETVAKAYTGGAYCYVFDANSGKWWLGLDIRHKLEDLI